VLRKKEEERESEKENEREIGERDTALARETIYFLIQYNKAMDFFDTHYFRINKFFLSFIGLWPYQMPFMKLLTRSFAIFGITIMCVPQVNYIIIFNEFNNTN